MSTWLGHKVPRYTVQQYSGCIHESVSGWLALESAGWVKQIALRDVRKPHPIWKDKKTGPSLSKRYPPPHPAACGLRTETSRFFHVYEFELKHLLLLNLEPAGIQTGTYTINSPGSHYQQILGLVSFHDHVNQFLIINCVCVHTYISLWFYVSVEPWLILVSLICQNGTAL